MAADKGSLANAKIKGKIYKAARQSLSRKKYFNLDLFLANDLLLLKLKKPT